MPPFINDSTRTCEDLRKQGLFKSERVISSPQAGQIRANDADVINLCANNYLGLASHPAIREAAHRAIDRFGYGMASVRFICGTQTVHKQLEAALSKFLGTEDTILYSSCWDANGGLFETVLGEQDAIISDCAESRQHHRRHPALQGAAPALRQSQSRRARAASQGHPGLPHAAHRHGRRVLHGRQHRAAASRSAISRTSTARWSWWTIRTPPASWAPTDAARPSIAASAAASISSPALSARRLGGGSGGYTSGKANAIAWLRQRSRPYLFSNSIPPVVAAVTLRALDLVDNMPALRDTLFAACAQHSAPACRPRASNYCPASIPSSR